MTLVPGLVRARRALSGHAKQQVFVAIPVIAVVLINGASLWCATRLRGAEGELRRTYIAKAEVQALVADLAQAEGGLGAYMLTRELTFLAPLDRARQLLTSRANRLNTAFPDSQQVSELRQLMTAADARLTALEQVRDDLTRQPDASSSSLGASGAAMRTFQTLASNILRQQDDLLDMQRFRAGVFLTLAIGAALVASLAGVGGGIIVAMVLSHARRDRDVLSRRRSPVPSSQTPASTQLSGSVLTVDDDPRIRELLQRWLAPHGLEFRQASDAQTALAAIAEHAPSVILCDIHMPGKDGLWLAQRVRTIAPNTAIILATGDSGISPFDSLREGVVSYVLKPFVRDQVLAAVEQGLRWAATRQSAVHNRASLVEGIRRLTPRHERSKERVS